jgi:hypothetical protein
MSPVFGEVTVAEADPGLTAEIAATGARLALTPWDGGVLTASLVPEGRFAPVAANLGPLPIGFVQFEAGAEGKLDGFRVQLAGGGQAYDFARE